MRASVLLSLLAASLWVVYVARVTDWPNPTFPTCVGDCRVLVTGASRGIGRAIVEALSATGHYTVYAGVRAEADLASFDDLNNVVGVKLDVANQTNIEDLIRRLPPLYGLVNNAGIGADTLFEIDTQFERVLHVNLISPMRLAKAVLPAMRKQRNGRIVNVGSIGGVLPAPTSVAYSTAKNALRTFSDSLRLETQPFGVHVSTMQTGFVKTRMADGVAVRMRKYQQELQQQPELKDFERFFTDQRIDEFSTAYRLMMGSMKEVTDDVEHALGAARPHAVYTQSVLKFAVPFLQSLPMFIYDRLMGVA